MNARTLEQLIDRKDPAWPTVLEWIEGANKPVRVLATDRSRAEGVLLGVQVTTRSPMGAIALESGGILVDDAWVRIFGAGCSEMNGDLLRWNGRGDEKLFDAIDGALLVGNDVLGGCFALDGGAFAGGRGNVFYFAPDALEWEDLEVGYSGFLEWAMQGDLDQFYEGFRWENWRNDIAKLPLDHGYSIQPPLWAEEGGAVDARDRRAVPMEQLLALQLKVAKQIAGAG